MPHAVLRPERSKPPLERHEVRLRGLHGRHRAKRHLDLRNVEGPAFNLLPRTLHATAVFYAAKYQFVWMLFAPFMLIPAAEYAAHRLYRRSRSKAAPAP